MSRIYSAGKSISHDDFLCCQKVFLFFYFKWILFDFIMCSYILVICFWEGIEAKKNEVLFQEIFNSCYLFIDLVLDVLFEKVHIRKVFILSGWWFRIVQVMSLLCSDTGALLWSLSINVFSSHQAHPVLWLLFHASGISPVSINLLWYFSCSFDLKWQTPLGIFPSCLSIVLIWDFPAISQNQRTVTCYQTGTVINDKVVYFVPRYSIDNLWMVAGNTVVSFESIFKL